MPRHKPLYEYAKEIKADWKTVYFGALPYLRAMADLDQITDTYIADDAKTIVLYFLANAATWRGETARRIKKELKSICEGG